MSDTLPPKIVVSCSQIEKSYVTGKVTTPALRGVDVTISEGELFMLVGPSGCGKTTLISIIAGILNQSAGEVELFGSPLSKMSEDEKTAFRGRNVGFVFQAYNLIPTLTTVENISIPLLLNGLDKRAARASAVSLLQRVGLTSKERAFPQNLSGGQQQRVAIARALAHSPKLIVCDEPTSALDHDTGVEIMELFKKQQNDTKTTLVIVTHDQRIFSYADRMAVMDDGKIIEVTTPSRSVK